jgi:menaquinone-dependent protoporphyrinogen IX oxidase
MSLFNNIVKASIAGGVVIGSAVAYARLSQEQREMIEQKVTKLRRKMADFIAPNDGAYDLPREVQEELEALLNDKE